MREFESVLIGDFLHRIRRPINLLLEEKYKLVTIKMNHKGVVLREEKTGALIKSKMYQVKEGDFILSGIDARNGAFGIVPKELDGAIVTNDFWYFEVDSKVVDKHFFLELTSTQWFDEICRKGSDGTTQRIRLQKDKFFNQKINLPAIEEQGRFITWFKQCKQKNNDLNFELVHQQTLLKKLRQQILQEAIEGKLTNDFRKKRKEELQIANDELRTATDPEKIRNLKLKIRNCSEAAVELLSRVQAEKEQLIKDKKIKKQKPLPAITEDEKPFELPEGWFWCRYGDVMQEIEAGKSPVCFNYPAKNNEWGVLKISAISWNTFQENENKKLKPNIVPFVDKEVKNDDFIMTRANTKELVAKSVVVSNVRPKLLLNDKTLRILFFKSVDQLFMNLFNNGEHARNHYIRFSTGASPSMKNISRDNIKRLLLPLPPFEEQKAIVAKVEKLLAICNELETQINQNQTHAEQLMQAVLKEAFSQNSEPEAKSTATG